MSILVGCSGWSYDDWVGRFYPIELAKRKGDWFAYYAQFFDTVEINSTFYRPPGERQVASWIKKAEKLEGFEYSVKVPQLVTHEALVEGNLERALFCRQKPKALQNVSRTSLNANSCDLRGL